MDNNGLHGLNVLSLFDGISCGMVALKRAGFTVNNYYAFEIDKNAIKCSASNYPSIIQCGNVFDTDFSNFENIDLIVGGVAVYVLVGYKSQSRNHFGRRRIQTVFEIRRSGRKIASEILSLRK